MDFADIDSATVVADRYVIQQPLGRGGDATVYAAHDRELNLIVALKVARRVSRGIARRFRRESSFLTRLAPSAPQLLGSGTLDDGRAYLAVEYINGVMLDRLQRVRPLLLDEALVCVTSVATTLRYLHSRGVIHRDVKPQNIIVPLRDGQLVLTRAGLIDYGMARDLVDAGGKQEIPSGNWSGTPLYMAPEQLVGRSQSIPTDVFALGATLHELVFGAAPMADVPQQAYVFEINGRELEVVLVPDRLTEDVALPDREIPASLARLVRGMLHKEPRLRTASTELVIASIAGVLSELGSPFAACLGSGMDICAAFEVEGDVGGVIG